jgi:hypothetical protein
LAAPRLIQHAERFAYTPGVPEKNFESSTPLVLFICLKLAQQLFGVGTAIGWHIRKRRELLQFQTLLSSRRRQKKSL